MLNAWVVVVVMPAKQSNHATRRIVKKRKNILFLFVCNLFVFKCAKSRFMATIPDMVPLHAGFAYSFCKGSIFGFLWGSLVRYPVCPNHPSDTINHALLLSQYEKKVLLFSPVAMAPRDIFRMSTSHAVWFGLMYGSFSAGASVRRALLSTSHQTHPPPVSDFLFDVVASVSAVCGFAHLTSVNPKLYHSRFVPALFTVASLEVVRGVVFC